jgi:phage host-nuclease inhibitor protein Gam
MTNSTNKRPSFILYKSFYEPIKFLKNDELGLLFRAIFDYQEGINVENLPPQVGMAFAFFKNQFDLDEQKYQVVLERNKSNGSKGGRPKKEETQDNPNNPVGFLEPKKGEKENEKENETVKDKEIEKKKVAKNLKDFIAPTLKEVEEYCKARNNSVSPQKFFDYYSAGNWKDAKGNQVRNWKQKLLTWEGKGDTTSQRGAQSNTNEALTLFINNLMGHTLIKSISVSTSNKAVLQFTNKPCFDLFVKMEDELKNQAKKKISDELGTNGFEPKY